MGFPIFGHELLILPAYLETVGFGVHNIPVPATPTLVCATAVSQGARIEVTGATFHIILTNGQDLVFGF